MPETDAKNEQDKVDKSLAIGVSLRLGFDGTVSGRVSGRLFSHTKKATIEKVGDSKVNHPPTPTHASTSIELSAEDLAKAEKFVLELAKPYIDRVVAITEDERGNVRRIARQQKEIQESEA